MRDIYVYLSFGPERRVEIIEGAGRPLVFDNLKEAKEAEPLARKSLGGAPWVSGCLVQYFAAHPVMAWLNEEDLNRG